MAAPEVAESAMMEVMVVVKLMRAQEELEDGNEVAGSGERGGCGEEKKSIHKTTSRLQTTKAKEECRGAR